MAFIKLIKILVYRIILLAGFLQIYRLIFDYLKNESNYNFEYEKDTQLDQNFTAFRDFIEDQENQEIDQFITIEPDDDDDDDNGETEFNKPKIIDATERLKIHQEIQNHEEELEDNHREKLQSHHEIYHFKKNFHFKCPTFSSLTKIPEHCPIDSSSNEEATSNTDRIKFLHHTAKHPNLYDSSLFPIYSVTNDSNSQLLGLRDIILLSVQLQKKLMIGSFISDPKIEHKTSKSEIPIGLLVDIGKLCKFVPLESQYDFQNKSNEGQKVHLDSDYASHQWNSKKYSEEKKISTIINFINKISYPSANRHLQMQQVYKFQNASLKIIDNFTYLNRPSDDQVRFIETTSQRFDLLPRNSFTDVKEFFIENDLVYDKKDKTKAAKTNSKIIGISGASNEIFRYTKKMLLDITKMDSIFERLSPNDRLHLKDYNLVKDLHRHIIHPKFIRDLAKHFMDRTKENYANSNPKTYNLRIPEGAGLPLKMIGVHWDFVSKREIVENSYFCKRKDIDKNESLDFISDSKLLIEKIISKVEENIPNAIHDNIIFISSPSSMAIKLKSALDKQNNFLYHKKNSKSTTKKYKIITSVDTVEYLANYQDHCRIFQDYFGHIIMEFEKELMVKSMAFYRSEGSNEEAWSLNVQGSRFGIYDSLPYDSSVFDLFAEENSSEEVKNESESDKDTIETKSHSHEPLYHEVGTQNNCKCHHAKPKPGQAPSCVGFCAFQWSNKHHDSHKKHNSND